VRASAKWAGSTGLSVVQIRQRARELRSSRSAAPGAESPLPDRLAPELHSLGDDPLCCCRSHCLGRCWRTPPGLRHPPSAAGLGHQGAPTRGGSWPWLDRGGCRGGWTLGWRDPAGRLLPKASHHHLQVRSDRARGPDSLDLSKRCLRASPATCRPGLRVAEPAAGAGNWWRPQGPYHGRGNGCARRLLLVWRLDSNPSPS